MTFFDENGEYWGNKTKPIINAANGRLNARRSGRIFFLFFLALKFIRFSVKIFADGRFLGFFWLGKLTTATQVLSGQVVQRYITSPIYSLRLIHLAAI